jgi:hypothetical protein
MGISQINILIIPRGG